MTEFDFSTDFLIKKMDDFSNDVFVSNKLLTIVALISHFKLY